MSSHLHLFTKTKSRSQLVRSVYSVYLSILRAPPLDPCTYSLQSDSDQLCNCSCWQRTAV